MSFSKPINNKFPFVHPSIASLLECQLLTPTTACASNSTISSSNTVTNDKHVFLDTTGERLAIRNWPAPIIEQEESSTPPTTTTTTTTDTTTEKENEGEEEDANSVSILSSQERNSLIRLAQECDDFVFEQHGLVVHNIIHENDTLLKLIDWGRNHTSSGTEANHHLGSATCLLASLLAVNRLEAAIRLATGHATAGRAPLLKSMIQKLHLQAQTHQETSYTTIAPVLQALLLPNPGLNLRNLLWHGFVATLPRPWLALVLVSICILEQQNSNNNNNNNISDERTTPTGVSESSVSSSTTQTTIQPSSRLPRLRCHAALQPLLQRGSDIISNQKIRDKLLLNDTTWILEALPKTTTSSMKSDTTRAQYQQWCQLIREWIIHTPTQDQVIIQYPLCTCILLTCLLEHGLRQVWCQVNHRPNDRMAQPGAFYVTLDGHGQRHQHDVLLHPFVGIMDIDTDTETDSAPPTRNQLIQNEHLLGGPLTALLTDLYCSPCGGPNLRASLAHGLWDDHLHQELSTSSTTTTTTTTNNNNNHSNNNNNTDVETQQDLQDMVRVLVAVIEELSRVFSAQSTSSTTASFSLPNPVVNYRPLFSYTAATCRNLDAAIMELDQLLCLTNQSNHQELFRVAQASANLPLASIQILRISWENLNHLALTTKQKMCGYCSTTDTAMLWTSNDVLIEYECNRVLASSGAVRTLLLEVAEACSTFRTTLEQALQDQESGTSTRQKRQRLRSIAASELALLVYTFAAAAAVVLLNYTVYDRPSDNKGHEQLVQAVKRSRMVLSTVSNFICTNTDRALKTSNEFCRSKFARETMVLLNSAFTDDHEQLIA